MFVVALADGRVRARGSWYLTYRTNFAAIRDGRGALPLGYFWTLAIEEQFYLVWPTLILFLPRRWLGPFLALVAATGPVSRAVLWALTRNYHAAIFATPSTLVSIGLGAILAWLASAPSRDRYRPAFRASCLGVGLGLGLAVEVWRPSLGLGARCTLTLLAMNLVFAWVVDRASDGFRGATGTLLGNRVVGYVGTISYGLYIFHPLVPRLCAIGSSTVLHRPVDLAALPGPERFLLAMTLSLVVSSASWICFEKPLNDLKRYFPYSGGRRKQIPAGPVGVAEGEGGPSGAMGGPVPGAVGSTR